MSAQSKITQTQVLDAISRAALTLDQADPVQAGLQQLLNEFRRTLLQTNGQSATTVLYQSKVASYVLQHPATYPATVSKLTTLLSQFVHSVA
ncbi:hypothetical protein D1831_06025 [Lactiplantibacillus garii]|uniref:Bacteriocin immunity protein n=1 Tax=Lactiplantibacillus garii TaxID=2306423 RepID=A0A426D843_9LACO|nr:hypothetical protein [Lactiplantibacillus garii]RRK10731.1 hypothetical protein D1831_06025 [Lactiplantibacillus garii]